MESVIILESKVRARALVADDASSQHYTIPHKIIISDEEASTEGFSSRESAWVDSWEETESSAPNYASVEGKVIAAYNG